VIILQLLYSCVALPKANAKAPAGLSKTTHIILALHAASTQQWLSQLLQADQMSLLHNTPHYKTCVPHRQAATQAPYHTNQQNQVELPNSMADVNSMLLSA
jgi:hypothetical protein